MGIDDPPSGWRCRTTQERPYWLSCVGIDNPREGGFVVLRRGPTDRRCLSLLPLLVLLLYLPGAVVTTRFFTTYICTLARHLSKWNVAPVNVVTSYMLPLLPPLPATTCWRNLRLPPTVVATYCCHLLLLPPTVVATCCDPLLLPSTIDIFYLLWPPTVHHALCFGRSRAVSSCTMSFFSCTAGCDGAIQAQCTGRERPSPSDD